MENINRIIETTLKNEAGELNLTGKIVAILIIFAIATLVAKIICTIIDKLIKVRRINVLQITDNRMTTLTEILKKVVNIVIYFIAVIMSLELFNINTTSLLATAGIGGLAIGFGAQSLVKDIITGFFILMEDQYSVGDHIKVGSNEGIVEELGVRVTKLRDFAGDLHMIPNGTIQVVSNKTRGAMRALVKMSIAYEEDIDRAMEVLEKAARKLEKEDERIVEGPTVLGVTDFGSSDVAITIISRTKPMEQWAVERAMRKAFKQAFDKEGIEIPYNKLVVFKGEDEDA